MVSGNVEKWFVSKKWCGKSDQGICKVGKGVCQLGNKVLRLDGIFGSQASIWIVITNCLSIVPNRSSCLAKSVSKVPRSQTVLSGFQNHPKDVSWFTNSSYQSTNVSARPQDLKPPQITVVRPWKIFYLARSDVCSVASGFSSSASNSSTSLFAVLKPLGRWFSNIFLRSKLPNKIIRYRDFTVYIFTISIESCYWSTKGLIRISSILVYPLQLQ